MVEFHAYPLVSSTWPFLRSKFEAWTQAVLSVVAPHNLKHVPTFEYMSEVVNWNEASIYLTYLRKVKREDLVIVETADYAFPLNHQLTPDRGLIYTNLFDLFMPYWDEAVTKWMLTNPIDGLHFSSVAYGRGEYVIECNRDGFLSHVNSLGIVKKNSKFWYDMSFNFCGSVPRSEYEHLLRSNWEYFYTKLVDGGPPYLTEVGGYTVDPSLLDMPLDADIVLRVYLRQDLVAVAFCQVDESRSELYWLQAHVLRNEETERLQVGKYIPYRLMYYAYTRGLKYVNMGIAHYPYKGRWTSVIREVPGFSMSVVGRPPYVLHRDLVKDMQQSSPGWRLQNIITSEVI